MSTLTADQSKVLEAIRYFVRRYEKAFPSIPVIAKVAGMCTRKAADHIRELVELGKIKKEQRWENGRQQSNVYEIVEEQTEEPKKEHADYKSSKKSFNNSFINKPDDDIYMTPPEFRNFFKTASEVGVPLEIVKEVFPAVRDKLLTVSWVAVRGAFNNLLSNFDRISKFGAWFKKALHTESLREAIGESELAAAARQARS